jgi:hypothetical protein
LDTSGRKDTYGVFDALDCAREKIEGLTVNAANPNPPLFKNSLRVVIFLLILIL